MNKKDVVINICDEQKIDSETEKFDITVVGKVYGDDKDFTIEYAEYDSEMGKCDTKINIKDGASVSVIRTGTMSSEMLFEFEKRHNCHYVTPYGSFMLGVYTKKVDFLIKEGETTLELEYTIDYNAGLPSDNSMTITVKNK
ncbi:MAG: DUF1934 domain-containing protein [Oscillospiraceae bacterium]